MALFKSRCGWITGILLLVALPGYGLTMTGKVFLDRNADRIMQPYDTGLQNAAVSDGRSVVLTDSSGRYELETESGRIVFVSLPKGYRAAKEFYLTAEDGRNMDFPMVLWPETKSDSIRFIHMTDLHITNKDTVDIFTKDIAEIGEMDPKPAFVIASGDLVNVADNLSEFESLMDAFSKVSVPVIKGIGNHDIIYNIGHKNYRSFCGPEYYSFNAGNCHFVLLDSTRFNDEQKAWLQKDLAAAPKGSRRIFIQHYLPSRANMNLFKELNVSAVMSGHWHGNRVDNNSGVLNLNTPPFRFAGIDRTPASFRVVDVSKNKLASELRFTGHQQRLTIVSPVGDVSAPQRKLQILVNTYDTWSDVDRVECFLNGKEFLLEKKSPWSWMGEIDAADYGRFNEQGLTVRAYGSNGKQWSAASSFKVSNAEPINIGDDWAQLLGGGANTRSTAEKVNPPLKMAWMANTGGMIGFSSPVVSRGILAIGVTDLDDLKKCGIAAFDVKSGTPRWHFRTDSAIKGQAAIDDGRVFAVSIAGHLYAVNLKTGKLLWKKELHGQIERWEISSPVVADGVVYAGSPVYLGAFDARTGKQLWERSIHTSVDKAGNKIWPGVHFGDWSDWIPSNYSVLTLSGDKLLIPTINALFAVDKVTGEPVWKSGGNTHGGIITNGVLYTIQSTVPTAIKLDSGETLWSGKEKLGDCASAPVLSGDRMVAGTGDGRVCAFSTKDGALLWSYQTGKALADMMPYVRGKSDVNSSPVISGDTVYVGASDGYLYALSLETGEKLWSYSLGVPIASSPVISGNALFIAGYDGTVYAFTGTISN
ncbi:MAG: outer membrane protein assembly factor BamB family protein [Armatimonadota bacterium]